MFDRILLRTIGTRLGESGNCPYNSRCPFAGGKGCFAPDDALEQRLSQVETTLRQEIETERQEKRINGGMVVRGTRKPSPWPCDELTMVVFVDP